MATRAKRTIDPKKVTDLDSWLRYYKSGYGNVVVKEGQYLVLDPVQYKADYKAALLSPVTTIAHTKAIDAHVLLAESDATSKYPQLRANAETTMTALYEDQQKHIAEATIAVNEAEIELLNASVAWRSIPVSDGTIATRSELAKAVAVATRFLENAEATLSAAKYPIRYIKAETGLLRKDLDYATHDDRKITNELYRIVVHPTKLADRIVPVTVTDKA